MVENCAFAGRFDLIVSLIEDNQFRDQCLSFGHTLPVLMKIEDFKNIDLNEFLESLLSMFNEDQGLSGITQQKDRDLETKMK